MSQFIHSEDYRETLPHTSVVSELTPISAAHVRAFQPQGQLSHLFLFMFIPTLLKGFVEGMID